MMPAAFRAVMKEGAVLLPAKWHGRARPIRRGIRDQIW